MKKNNSIHPQDAATLIIIDTSTKNYKILMGRRHQKHKFMPGVFVFPGGKVEKNDANIPCTNNLDANIKNKIFDNLRGRPTQHRVNAMALAAIRETCEETGLMIGKKNKLKIDENTKYPESWNIFINHAISPTLEPLKLIARAITPPGRTRRYDTWFFATDHSHIAHNLNIENLPDNELQEIHWITIKQAKELEIPSITRTILTELTTRLESDPNLNTNTKIPFFHQRKNQWLRDLI